MYKEKINMDTLSHLFDNNAGRVQRGDLCVDSSINIA